MTMTFHLMIAGIACLFSFTGIKAQELTILTEEYPPYQSQAGGKASGLSLEIAQELLKELKIEKKIEFNPWARAWKRATTEKNIMLFSVMRNPERENMFHWIGPIVNVNNCLFSTDIKLSEEKSLADLKLKPYVIGTVRDDIFESFLISQKFPEKQIHRHNSHEGNYKMMLAGRLDFWAVDEVTAKSIARQSSADEKSKKELFKGFCMGSKDSNEGIYFVLSKNTDQTFSNKVKEAFSKIKSKNEYREIVQKYKK